MRNRLRSRQLRRGPLTVLPCAALAASLGLGACGSSGSGSGSSTSTTVKQTIAASADDTPAVTVTSYLDALSRHDFSLAKMFLHPKAQKGIVAAAGSGFVHLVSFDAVKIASIRTGVQYRPVVDGFNFAKDSHFAQVTVSYTATFSSGPGSGPQTRVVTLGENSHSRWLILVIRSS